VLLQQQCEYSVLQTPIVSSWTRDSYSVFSAEETDENFAIKIQIMQFAFNRQLFADVTTADHLVHLEYDNDCIEIRIRC
jgi:hypothetical protein